MQTPSVLSQAAGLMGGWPSFSRLQPSERSRPLTLRYTLMGIAAWLVWRQRSAVRTRPALSLFLFQLGANALWCWLFFAWHKGAFAFADVVLLLLLIATMVAAF